MAAHDPKLEEELIMKLTDKVAFIQRLEKSVYNTDVNGLEGQKECLRIAFRCIDAQAELKSAVQLHFSMCSNVE